MIEIWDDMESYNNLNIMVQHLYLSTNTWNGTSCIF